MTRRLIVAAMVALVVAAVPQTAVAEGASAAGEGASTAAERASAPVERVLVLSLPAVSWADIEQADTPNLDALFADSALGDLITRVGGRRFSVGNGYVSFGAGNRGVASDRLVGSGFDVDEDVAGGTAGTVFARRTGQTVTQGLVQLNIEKIRSANAASLYDATVGALADRLEAAGIERAVIGNADGFEAGTTTEPGTGVQRPAVAGLMGSGGTVPGGQVDDTLLEEAPRFPFGVRLDVDRVDAAFAEAWSANTVVLVEASDQLRARRATPFTAVGQARRDRLRALRHFDAIAGRILSRVDADRDAVIVMSPMSAPTSGDLVVASLRAPGVTRGLLRSSTTRRTGFVSLVDLAPTVLDLIGIDPPDIMEGRVVTVEPAASALDGRVSWLARASRDGVFRDNQQGAVAATVVGLAALLALATGFALASGRVATSGAPSSTVTSRATPGTSVARRAARFGALALLGFLLATYAAGPLHFAHHGGRAAYWLFLVLFSSGFGLVCTLVGRRSVADALLVALGVTVAVHALDLVMGERLELSTVFGYSPTVGIRVAGEGNLTFAQLSATTLLFAGLSAWRIGRDLGQRLAVGLLAVVLVIMVSPVWGQDFGATTAAAGFGLLAWLLFRRPVRRSTVIGLGVGVVVIALVIGFVDLARPIESQTHIGRFFAQVGDEGISGLIMVVQRKATENLASFVGTVFVWVLPIAFALGAFLWMCRPGLILALRDRIDTLSATFGALALTALLGYAFNDSGVAIPAMMLVIGECAVVYLLIGEAERTPQPVPDGDVARRELRRGVRADGAVDTAGEPVDVADPAG